MADVRSGLDPKDYKFINPNPDPDFSPERNKAIIDETIQETNRFFRDFGKVRNADGQNRLDILKSYAIHTLSKGGSQSLRQYLGKQQYEALIGEKILSKLRIAETVNRLHGNTRFKKGILL